MKLRASRVDIDVEDIRLLLCLCGFTTVKEGLDLLERSYPSMVIEPKIQYVLAEIIESMQPEDADVDRTCSPSNLRGRQLSTTWHKLSYSF